MANIFYSLITMHKSLMGGCEILINCFTDHDRVGVVGPKILSMDGRLQEGREPR